jgi:hypothetical protein
MATATAMPKPAVFMAALPQISPIHNTKPVVVSQPITKLHPLLADCTHQIMIKQQHMATAMPKPAVLRAPYTQNNWHMLHVQTWCHMTHRSDPVCLWLQQVPTTASCFMSHSTRQ